nr:hypothetical protein [Kofleriaceae bacterium]
MKLLVAAALIACGTPLPVSSPPPAAMPAPGSDAAPIDAADAEVAPLDAAPSPDADLSALGSGSGSADPNAEVWLRGNTHVHAKPSGDSTEPIANVIAWYEARHYDFIVLTDHNQVSEIDPANDTHGQVAVRNPAHGLIVLAGAELTHNPTGCEPPGDASRKCRIHVNAIGVTARPVGKISWAHGKTHDRIAKYQLAFDEAKLLGATLIQINHPQWFWGMQPSVLIELVKRGATLMEVGNAQFEKWNVGDKDHPSTEQLWDAALQAGETLWGTASDDAHYYGKGHGQWPAGGAWIVVHARRDPQAILDAIAHGHFYASNGVELVRAGTDGGDLVVEVAPGQSATTIQWIENGTVVDTTTQLTARRAIPATGYLRADVVRDDGKRAWIEPVRSGQGRP